MNGVRTDQCSASSYFFLDGTYSQTAAQVFGPQSTSAFRTTSKLICTGSLYTPCKGKIMVQPQQGNPDKVNVILAPYDQPISTLCIRYIIYRGLKKSDFFVEQNDQLILAGSETTGTVFCQKLWKSFRNFYRDQQIPEPDFLASFIGYVPESVTSQLPHDNIDAYFYYNPALLAPDNVAGADLEALELPLLDGGTQLGLINGEEIGVDIVLGNGQFYDNGNTHVIAKFDLLFARKSENILRLDLATATEKKALQQMATCFVDIAVFYNLHANGLGRLYVPNSSLILKTPEEILPKIAGFSSRDTVYIHIQSERGQYYNYYGNYGSATQSNFKLAQGTTPLAEIDFGTSGWPVHVLKANSTVLHLALYTDRDPGTNLYVITGDIDPDVAHEDGFFRKGNIIDYPLPTDPVTELTNFTKQISFTLKDHAGTFVGTRIDLLYEGSRLGIEQDNAILVLKDIDDTFGLLQALPMMVQPEASYYKHTVVSDQKMLLNFKTGREKEDIALVGSKCVHDIIYDQEKNPMQRVTFETTLQHIKRELETNATASSSRPDLVCSAWISYRMELNNYYVPDLPYGYQTIPFTVDLAAINGIKLTSIDGSIPSKKMLGITQQELSKLIGVISINQLFYARIYFLPLLDNAERSVAAEGIPYSAYKLGVVAEDAHGNLTTHFPNEALSVYTLDDYCFFSEAYSQYIKETKLEDFYTFFNI